VKRNVKKCYVELAGTMAMTLQKLHGATGTAQGM
jgi:hypothetical protein